MANDRPRWRIWWAALLLVGCTRFQPVVQLPAKSGDVEMELKYLRVGPFGELVFAARSTDGHPLSQAWFTVASRSPCTGGDALDDIRVDGERMGFLPAGEHQVSLWPAGGKLQFGLDTVVDIRTDAGCLRVPAVTQSVPLVPAARPTLVLDSDVIFAPMPSGLWALVGVSAGIGPWIGPVQLIGKVGFAGANCRDSTCGRDAQNNLRVGSAIPISAEARYGLGSWQIRSFVNNGFVEARYVVTPFWLPLPGGEQRYTAQSVFGAFGWGFLELPPGPFRHLERATQIELAIPLGVTSQSGGGGRHTVFSGGMTVRFAFSL